MNNLSELLSFVENELHGDDLRGHAASSAARTLVENWVVALWDGSTDNLIADIDITIEYLSAFKRKAQAALPKANGGVL